MSVYEYTALDAKGKKRSGIIDAESPAGARARLRETGLFPVEIVEAPEASPSKKGKGFSFSFSSGKAPAKHVAITTRQLSTLVGAGLPIVSSLEALIPQSPHPVLQKVLAHVKDNIVGGTSLADALSVHPRVFPNLYVNMVRAGEASGTIEVVLARLADLMESNETTRAKIRSAMTYPIIMLIVAIIILTVLMVKVVPTIISLFENVKLTLPLPTRILIVISNFIVSYWWAIGAGIIIFIFAMWRFKRTKRGRLWWDSRVLRVPLFGPLAINLTLSRFGRTLASLLQNGVPLVPAMGIVKNVVENVVIANGIGEAVDQISEGRGLGESLSGKPGFFSVTIQMMEVGEHSGELETMLDKIADMYQTEAENAINSLTASLEPLMIVAMGGIVGFIVFSVLMPMVELTTRLR